MQTRVRVVRDMVALVETQNGIVKVKKVIGGVVLVSHVASNVLLFSYNHFCKLERTQRF